MKLHKCFTGICVMVMLGMYSAVQGASPNGFVIWSEGDHEHRELKYIELRKGEGAIASSKKTVVSRADYADIECVISYDGTYVAFARQLEHYTGCCTDNPGDYHGFGNYDIYIARIDGDLPATSIRVGHGYFPCWGENSGEPTKTLYYSWCEGNRGPALKIKKVTINRDGSISAEETHLENFGTSSDPHMQCAPDGEKVAYRATSNGTGIRIYDAKNEWTSDNLGGCHPSWGRYSYWLLWARNNKCAYKDSHVYVQGSAGLGDNHYHIGTSQDMNWVVARIGHSGNDQNTPYPIIVYPLDASAKGEPQQWDISTNEGVEIGEGTWCDIHATVEASIQLSVNAATISPGGHCNVTASFTGGVTGDIEWSVTGGGNLSEATNDGVVFTSNGTLGEFIISACVGDVTSDVAIEVVDPASIHVKINSGGPQYKQWQNSDNYASGGESYPFGGQHDVTAVNEPAPDTVYQSVLHYDHDYNVPVPKGNYIARLHFTDANPGGRKMDYYIEGQQVIYDMSVVDEAGGSNTVLIKEFNVTVSDDSGMQIKCRMGDGNDVFEAGLEIIGSSVENTYGMQLRQKNYPGTSMEVHSTSRKGIDISYNVSCRCQVRMIVSDMSGRTVKALTNATIARGRHEIRWDARRDDKGNLLSSGIYICHLFIHNDVADIATVPLFR